MNIEREYPVNSDQNLFRIGDWVVHVFYGLGQIVDNDEKVLEGKKRAYLKVKTSDSIYWIPIENFVKTRVRPLASKNQFKYALTLIRKPPKKLPKDYLQRKREITRTLKIGSLYSRARIMRDLHGRRTTTAKFNINDNNTLLNIKEQFLNEWVMAVEEDRGNLEAKLDRALEISVE